MRYAVLSDIHGNAPALRAALRQIDREGADKVLFLGDYTIDLPFCDEVVDMLRARRDAVVIQGNKERYLLKLDDIPTQTWTFQQFMPVYHCYGQLSEKNLAYLRGLPAQARIEDEHGFALHLYHSMRQFLPDGLDGWLRSSGHRDRALLPGAYLFGHNHLQYHLRCGDCLLVDPGSCGMALDGDNTAAYTLLTTSPEGIKVQQRRIAYDVEGTIAAYRRTEAYRQTPFWREIIVAHLRTAAEHLDDFWPIAARFYKGHASIESPMPNAAWEMAVSAWREARSNVIV